MLTNLNAAMVNLADLDLDDTSPNEDEPKPRQVQLEQIHSLVSPTPAMGPAWLKELQAGASPAVTAHECRPILESEKKVAAESNQVQNLSQQVAQVEKVLQDVMEYKQLVNAPQRAAATSGAAGMATFAQEFPTVSDTLSSPDACHPNCCLLCATCV